MKIRVKIDSRIRPLIDRLEYVRKNLKAGMSYKTSDFYTDRTKTDPDFISMLLSYGIIRKESPGSYNLKDVPITLYGQIYKELSILFWLITSRGFSEAKVFESKESLNSWIQFLNMKPGWLNGHRFALKLLNYGKRYKSGLILNTKRRYTEPVPSQLSDIVTSPQMVKQESDLYEPLKQFLHDHRPREEGFDYTGWSNIIITDPGKNRTGQTGDWGNPDLFAYRIDPDPFTGQQIIESVAIEVKKKESYTKSGVRFTHFKKTWVSQAQSYHRFANIVYLAVNTTIEKILTRPIIVRYLIDAGIGLLLLKDDKNLSTWYEAIPPGFRIPRPEATRQFMLHLYQDNGSKIQETQKSATV